MLKFVEDRILFLETMFWVFYVLINNIVGLKIDFFGLKLIEI